MKKIIAVVLVLLSVGSITAQDGSGVSFRKHRLGVKIAPGLSYLNIDKLGQVSDGVDYTFGYGLQYEYGFSENFSISTGILMNSFRGNVSYSDSLFFVFDKTVSGIPMKDTANQILGRKYTFKSVDIPLALKLKTPEIGYLTYFAEFGTTLSIIYDSYSSKNEVILNEGDAKAELSGDSEKLDANDDVSLFKGALNIGIGAEYNLVGNTSLLFGVNWNSAFTNILSKTSDEIFYIKSSEKFNQIVKSDYISVSVGVQF
jgi:hypothetical protein